MNKTNNTYIVIGSGPSGVSCASALIKKKNIKVLMLDSGYELEKKIKSKVNSLYNLNYKKWPKKKFNKTSGEYHKGIPLKKIFGSDYVYKTPAPYKFKHNTKIGLRPSFAKGGFTNIWGSTIMPFNKNDILDWPLPFKSLEPYYKEVVKIFNISGQKDSLSKYFPLFKKKLINLKFSDQGNAIYQFLKKNEKHLKRNGLLFGKSRLAFNKSNYSHPEGCIYCGMCLTGCPKKIIYSSNSTLNKLKKEKNFQYLSGYTVTNLKENTSNVKLYAMARNSNKKKKLTAEKVFIGAGVLQTTSIIANSLKLKNHKFEIKDNSLFYLPLLFKKGFSNIYDHEVNTLSQIFFEIIDKKISNKFIHAQLYLYNSLYKRELNKYLFPFKYFFPGIIEKFISRLTILQIYLHSDYSSKIIFHYNSNKPHEFSLEEEKNKKTYEIIRKILKKIKKNKKFTGLYPVLLLNKILRAGQSYHCGGTLPMQKKKTKNLSTDLLGRPKNFKRIHCIDASVLPSIPATTITLSVMANAYRIGSES